MHWRKGIGIHADAPAGLSSTAHRLTREVGIKGKGKGKGKSHSHSYSQSDGDGSGNNCDYGLSFSNSIDMDNNTKAMVIA